MDASEIIPGLWQGAFPLPEEPLAIPVDVVVSCTSEFEPPHDFFAGGLIQAYRPMDDAKQTPEQIEYARQLADIVIYQVNAGRRVLVHCAAGLNRSGFVVALALKSLLGISGEAAILHVQSRRGGALCNPWFCEEILR